MGVTACAVKRRSKVYQREQRRLKAAEAELKAELYQLLPCAIARFHCKGYF